MFISSCGATVSAVLGALAIGDGSNYLMVFIGGLVILAVYGIFALIVKLTGPKTIMKLFPPTIVGAVTIVIGINLAAFIFTYVNGHSVFILTALQDINVARDTIIPLVDEFGKPTINIASTTVVPWLYVLVALITMSTTAAVSHYGKGFMKNIPFLFGLAAGYIVALILTLTKVAPLVSFDAFNNLTWYPDLTFLH